jgi:hypothetical protein
LIQSVAVASPVDPSIPRSRDLARLRGFGHATLIETRRGPIPAIEIRRGDQIRTSTGELAEVIWMDRLHLDACFLRSVPALKPVLICEGDLGFGPLRNVVLSPEQFVWDDNGPDGPAFRRAAEVTRQPGVFARRDVSVTYVSLLCDRPVAVEAEGLWVSLIP